jgi:hypothetical protein
VYILACINCKLCLHLNSIEWIIPTKETKYCIIIPVLNGECGVWTKFNESSCVPTILKEI